MAVLSCLMFLLLELCLEVSASYSVSGLYQGVWYKPVEHYALLGQSFMNISGISAVRCSVRCLSHRGCFSFNYERINQACQMNNVSAEHVCDNLQGMPYFSYYDATATPLTCQNTYVSGHGKSVPEFLSFEKLGLEDGSIPDESLSASSNYISSHSSTPAGGRLNKLPGESAIGGWHPSVADTNQWIEVDLGNSTYVTGVLTQGRSGGPAGQWVTMYKVQYEPPSPTCLVDVKDQLGQTQMFNGNIDRNSIVERRFFKPVLAVKIRIVPVGWRDFICLRFELLGCK
ncbi:retinoschisin-like isoform X2 [Asterias amurensis]|uniref:retinoschisin-like isoform X2 n=1 Tax=Asterias amurensis TaxID=7602 RepID=UPI003AB44E23